LHRFGYLLTPRAVPALLVLIDFGALGIAREIMSLSARATILLTVIVLGVSAASRNYRAQPLGRELAVLAAVSLVAGVGVTAVKVQLGVPVHNGPLLTAGAFLALAGVGRVAAHAARRGWNTEAASPETR
jgi:heme A synthase